MPANVSLTGAILVGYSGIVKVDALFKAIANDVAACCFVQRPAMLTRRRIAKPHASHADAGNK